MTNQTQLKQLCSRAQPDSQIPKAKNMVKVSSLMSEADHVQFGKGLVSVFVDVPQENGSSQIFSVRPQFMVPSTAVIQRDEASQLVGISAVSGG